MKNKDVILDALQHIPVSDTTYFEWIRIGIALKNEGFDVETWREWSEDDQRYDEGKIYYFWNGFKPGNCKAGSILYIAKQFGYIPPEDFAVPDWKQKLENYYQYKHEWLDKRKILNKGYGAEAKVIAEYPYTDSYGNYLYSKIRIEGGMIEGKVIAYYHIDYDRGTYENIYNRKDVLYKLPELLEGIKKGYPVIIVEGEKDVESLKHLDNFPCTITTSGSCTSWKKEYGRIFKGCNVIIFQDNDEEGENLTKKMLRDVKPYAHSIKVIKPSRLPKGDITDFLQMEGGTAEQIKGMINSAEPIYAPWVIDKGKSKVINAGLLARYISQNEHYKIVRLPDDDKDRFYLYVNGVYNFSNKNSIKSMIADYIPNSLRSDALLNNVYSLILASEEHLCSYENLNADTRYANFRNGLLDTATDSFIEHTPDIITLFQYDFDYEPTNRDMPNFTEYMKKFCSDSSGTIDKEKLAILQEAGGILLSPDRVSKTKKAVLLLSYEGNSGKSVFISLLESFYGLEYVLSVKLMDLVPDKQFALGRLATSRLITCGDESNTTVKDSTIFKSLTGNDGVKNEAKGKQGFTIRYKGGLILACNELPVFADDKGTQIFERLEIIPCEHHIEPEDRDPLLIDKLIEEKQAIFNFFYQGYKRLKNNGYRYSKCEACDRAVEEHRLKSDSLYRYISEHCEITKCFADLIGRSEFDNAYLNWCIKEDINHVSKNNIRFRMESIGIQTSKMNLNSGHDNMNCYIGVKWKN